MIVQDPVQHLSPLDPEKPFVTSGIRVGTPAVTSRYFKAPDMVHIARWTGQTAVISTVAGSRSTARWMPSGASSPSTSKPGGSAIFSVQSPSVTVKHFRLPQIIKPATPHLAWLVLFHRFQKNAHG